MGLFGKGHQPDPKEMVNDWTKKLRKEQYSLERQIKNIQREEEKAKRLCKDSAKRGEKEACRIIAKEIVNSKKCVRKLYASKAQLNSVQMSMKHQLANLRIAGALSKSTDVMKSMQSLIKVPEVQATMREMSKEMMKMGIIEEMMEDTMEDVLEDEELEDEADEEVEKILFDLTAGELGKAPAAVDDSLPVLEGASAGAAAAGPSRTAAEPVALEEDDDLDDMKARLEALRS